ncbi:hypothetical protein [Pontiella sp.]|uniref:hypothetical protein n=1 Tax=Pontiella sp. TaxID=2837462 RepID=UPI003564B10F
MSPRALIRKAVCDTMSASPGFRLVEVGRRHKLNEKRQLPAAIIYTDREEQTLITSAPVTFEHELELRVVLYVKAVGSDSGEAALDELCEGTEALVVAAMSVLDGVQYAFPSEWEVEADGETNADFLVGTRTFRVVYHSAVE